MGRRPRSGAPAHVVTVRLTPDEAQRLESLRERLRADSRSDALRMAVEVALIATAPATLTTGAAAAAGEGG